MDKKKKLKKKSDYNNPDSFQDELDLVLQLLAGAKKVESDLVKDYRDALEKYEKLYYDIFPFYFKDGVTDERKYRELYESFVRGQYSDSYVREQLDKINRDLQELQVNRLVAWLILDYETTVQKTAESIGTTKIYIPADVRLRVAEPWCKDGKTFYDRIRANVGDLDRKLRYVILRGVKEGWSLDKMTETLQQLTGTAAYKARRLIRTETMAVYSKATKDEFLENGIEYVEIIGDAACGGICLDYVGEAIPLRDAIIGDDLPPYHPNCACSFCSYVEFDKE